MTNNETMYFNLFKDLLKSYEQIINSREDEIANELASENITMEFAKKIMLIENEVIEQMNFRDIETLLEETGSDPKGLISYKMHNDYENTESFISWCINFLKQLKSDMLLISNGRKELANNKNEELDIVNNFIDKLKSPEYREARLQRLEKLKKEVKTVTDEKEKREMQKLLDTIEKSQNYTCILDRLKKYGKKEADTLVNIYFEKNRGAYTLQKYYYKLNMYNLPANLHDMFINIEEKLLPDYYAPFNNFFLFAMVRYIAYSNPKSEDDRLVVSSFLAALRDIIQDKATQDMKFAMVNVIKEFYTYFDNPETIERFKNNNSTYKFHPDRIEAEKKIKEEERKNNISKIKYELGSILEESDNIDNIENPSEYVKKLIKLKFNISAKINEDVEYTNLLTLKDLIDYELNNKKEFIEEIKKECNENNIDYVIRYIDMYEKRIEEKNEEEIKEDINETDEE